METILNNRKEISLSEFTGTENYYKTFTGILLTDGVQYLAEVVSCYWLVDAIGSYQHTKAIKELDIQFWQLTKDRAGDGAKLTCVYDTGYKPIISQSFSSVDFPFAELGNEFKLYLQNNVLMLPSEY